MRVTDHLSSNVGILESPYQSRQTKGGSKHSLENVVSSLYPERNIPMKYTKLRNFAFSLAFIGCGCTATPALAAPQNNCVIQTVMCTGVGGGGSTPSQSSSGGDYQTMAYNDAVAAGIDPFLFQKQINQESGWRVDVVSSAGAIGIAQIMPATAKSWGVDPWNAADSLSAAAQHMHEYYVNEGDYAKALGDYNAGHGFVLTAEKGCSDWLACMPVGTRAYIHKIMG